MKKLDEETLDANHRVIWKDIISNLDSDCFVVNILLYSAVHMYKVFQRKSPWFTVLINTSEDCEASFVWNSGCYLDVK